jgi:DnaD/phage-associated family protein
MCPFAGFPDEIKDGVILPEVFLSRALPVMTSIDEARVCMQFFRLLKGDAEGYLTAEELLEAENASDLSMTAERVTDALEQATDHGILLLVSYRGDELYFINTPRARSIQRANAKGVWRPGMASAASAKVERPNVYSLYEQNIGPLTPLLAQTLEDAEAEYSSEWVSEAITIAVKKNARNWKYVEAILRSWKEKGRNETDRRNTEENPRNYIEGDLADFIKH